MPGITSRNVEFFVPHVMEDLEKEPQDDRYWVQSNLDATYMTPLKIQSLLSDLSDELNHKCLAIACQESFDELYSLTIVFSKLTVACKSLLLSSLKTGLIAVQSSVRRLVKEKTEMAPPYGKEIADRTRLHRTSLKMYCLLLCHICTVAEKQAKTTTNLRVRGKKGKKKKDEEDDFGWFNEKEAVAAVLADVVESKSTFSLWNMAAAEAEFGNLIFQTATSLMENKDNFSSTAASLQQSIIKMFACSVSRFDLASNASTSVLHMLTNFSHLSTHIASLMGILVNKYNCERVVAGVIREIGRVDSTILARDVTGARNIAVFLEELGTEVPGVALQHFSLLLSHLDGESYAIRNGVVKLTGALVEHGFKDGNAEKSTDQNEDTSEEHTFGQKPNQQTKSMLLELLQERLAKAKAIPSEHLPTVVSLAADRLQDKTAAVRKFSIILLTSLLEYNPYSPSLALEPFQTKLQAVATKFKAEMDHQKNTHEAKVKKAAGFEDKGDEEKTVDEEEKTEKSKVLEEEAFDAHLKQLKSEMETLYQAVKFISGIDKSVSAVAKLLHSSTKTDVLEAVKFSVIAHEFQIASAPLGIQKLLALIWSKESQVKEAVIEAYRRLYIGQDLNKIKQKNIRAKLAHSIAQNLIWLTRGVRGGLKLHELASLEELVMELSKTNQIPTCVVEALWEIFVSADSSSEDRSGSLLLLNMMAGADSSIIANNVASVVSIGLGPRAMKDPLLARTTSLCLQKLKSSRFSPSVLQTVFGKLTALILNTSDSDKAEESLAWFPVCEQALNTLFALHPAPEAVSEQILRIMAKRTLLTPAPGTARGDKKTGNGDTLAKLFFAVGHVAVKSLVLLERVEGRARKAQSALRARNADKKSKKTSRSKGAKSKGKQQKTKLIDGASDDDEDNSNKGSSAIEEELAVGASDDFALEQLRDEAERALVESRGKGSNLLSLFAPIVLDVVSHPSAYPHALLQSSAALALSKLMCISRKFCEANLQLLFTLLKHSKDPKVRVNIIVALGDLAVRFPNLIEPWSGHMNSMLDDSDVSVRKNTLMVLTHLILNDMQKAKGPVSKIAKCLEDPDERISDAAKTFFHELSNKGKNPVYNILPDVISKLTSDPSVTDVCFKNVLKFLIAFISKDKQTESLVEKLCHRFTNVHVDAVDNIEDASQLLLPHFGEPQSCTGEAQEPSRATSSKQLDPEMQQCRNLAYCLSQLNFSATSLKKLQDPELFRCYQNTLGDEQVLASFLSIAKKARSFSKAETKQVIDDYEAKLLETHAKQKEDIQANRKANRARRALARAGGTEFELSDEDEEQSALAAEAAALIQKSISNRQAGKGVLTKQRRKKAPLKAKSIAPKKAPTRRRKKKVIVESSSEESSSSESMEESSDSSDVEEIESD